MPFYEYKCESCGHQFEVMQRITAEPLTKCERCGGPVRRIIFPSAIVYKGSGFYSTEYGRSRFNHPTSPKTETTGSSKPKETADSTSSEKKESASESAKPSKPSSEAAA